MVSFTTDRSVTMYSKHRRESRVDQLGAADHGQGLRSRTDRRLPRLTSRRSG